MEIFLHETMRDLPDLAEACLETALSVVYSWLSAEYGTPKGKNEHPQHLVVIGLGELGGEKNFRA